MNRILENILRLLSTQRLLRPVQAGVRNIQSLRRSNLKPENRLKTRKLQTMDVPRPPNIIRVGANIIDVVALAPMKQNNIPVMPSDIHLRPALITPSTLRLQIRITHIGRIR